MAESQISFRYTPEAVRDLLTFISDPRFGPFRQKAGFQSDELAFEFYLYNARLSKSLLFPIHICEVTLRNSVNRVFADHYTAGWWRQPALLDLLTSESRASLEKAVAVCARKGQVSADDLVPTLTLDFWSNLFRREYNDLIWKRHLRELIPNSAANFDDFNIRLRDITRLRNRIAHHESILSVNISERQNQIHFVLGQFSTHVLQWVKAHSTVHKVLRTLPDHRSTASKLSSRADPAFLNLSAESKFSELQLPLASPYLIRGGANEVVAVVDARDVSNYILSTSEDWCLLDFGLSTIADLMVAIPSTKQFILAHESEDVSSLYQLFKKDARYVVVHRRDAEEIVGVIARAHRRY